VKRYRGYELTPGSAVGGVNISKDGEYVDHVVGDYDDARAAVDRIVEVGRTCEECGHYTDQEGHAGGCPLDDEGDGR
jgi:hypothetical protein